MKSGEETNKLENDNPRDKGQELLMGLNGYSKSHFNRYIYVNTPEVRVSHQKGIFFFTYIWHLISDNSTFKKN